jgi:hypothetical protein
MRKNKPYTSDQMNSKNVFRSAAIMRSVTRLPRKIEAAQNLVWRPLNQSSRVSLISRISTATKMVRWCLNWSANASQNGRVDAQTSIATILEFPTPRVRVARVPAHARPCTVDDVEFYYLKLIQHLCNVTCRPLTLWPSDRYGPRWAGREAWVTCGDGRTREMPADAARGSTALMTLLPRHYHARIVKHYAS